MDMLIHSVTCLRQYNPVIGTQRTFTVNSYSYSVLCPYNYLWHCDRCADVNKAINPLNWDNMNSHSMIANKNTITTARSHTIVTMKEVVKSPLGVGLCLALIRHQTITREGWVKLREPREAGWHNGESGRRERDIRLCKEKALAASFRLRHRQWVSELKAVC